MKSLEEGYYLYSGELQFPTSTLISATLRLLCSFVQFIPTSRYSHPDSLQLDSVSLTGGLTFHSVGKQSTAPRKETTPSNCFSLKNNT